MNDEEDRDLSSNCTNGDTEVHTQTSKTGNDQGQNQTGITAETGSNFTGNVAQLHAGDQNERSAENHEQNNNLIVQDGTLHRV